MIRSNVTGSIWLSADSMPDSYQSRNSWYGIALSFLMMIGSSTLAFPQTFPCSHVQLQERSKHSCGSFRMAVSRKPTLVACVTHAFRLFQRTAADLILYQLQVCFDVVIIVHCSFL